LRRILDFLIVLFLVSNTRIGCPSESTRAMDGASRRLRPHLTHSSEQLENLISGAYEKKNCQD